MKGDEDTSCVFESCCVRLVTQNALSPVVGSAARRTVDWTASGSPRLSAARGCSQCSGRSACRRWSWRRSRGTAQRSGFQAKHVQRKTEEQEEQQQEEDEEQGDEERELTQKEV